MTQEEVSRHFKVGSSTISRNLIKIDYSRKKKSKTYSERSEEKRAAYLNKISQLSDEEIVYVDESGMNDNDFYPYSALGKRYYEAHPGHYIKRISMIGALCEFLNCHQVLLHNMTPIFF